MATTAEAFQAALTHHQAGRLREAEAIYRQILQADPQHADSLHLLGVVAYQVGQPAAAVDLIGRAVRLPGDQAAYHGNLGEVYRTLGQMDQAEQSLRRALALDPTLADAHNSLGDVHRVGGRVTEAVESFREAIRLRPAFAEAHNNLGTVLQSQGDLPAAIRQYERALELNPRYVAAFNNLGTAHQDQGNLSEAARCYRNAQALAPGGAEGYLNLGTVHQAEKKFDEAIACYRQALRLNPRWKLALNNLGAALKELKQFEEAEQVFRQAIALDPTSAESRFNLGTALQGLEDWAGAAAEHREALRLEPQHVKALISLSTVLQQLGDVSEAMALADRAVALAPDLPKAHLNRANLYRHKRMTAEAVAHYQTALRLKPDYAEACNNLAVLLTDLDEPDAAVEYCQRGMAIEPDSAALVANLSTALQNLGLADEAIAAARRSVALRPEGVGEHTNLLYKLNFHPDYDPPSIFAEHLAWAARHAEPLTKLATPHANDRTSERRLRVGYVSPYFREHAVNFFTEPMITAHDPAQYEVYCYSDVGSEDAATARLRQVVPHWREVRSQSDAQLAELVRADRIDLLVDLTGHIAGNRLLTFARKPAPLQVTYIGYQNTTGMSAMDYRLTDDWADPPGLTDALYTEKLVRLPDAFFCYRPGDDCPPVAPLPAGAQGHVTFGSLNNFAKVNPQVLETWLEILKRVARSRLLILARSGGSVQKRVEGLAREQGIDPARIEFCDKRPRRAYMELFGRVDIGLDPFPFNGHTTTCDSIWMGVPVVMLAGGSYASRFGGSVLRPVGLEHWITDSRATYVDRAVELAGDVETLRELRCTLRERMAGSVLLDAAGFTRNLESAYRRMWSTWCGGQLVPSNP